MAIALFAAFSTLSSHAQTADDDTLAKMPADVQAKLMALLREELSDPYSARLVGLVHRNGYICGRVNARNKFGAYTGRTLFAADINSGRFVLVVPSPPGQSVEELKSSLQLLEVGRDICAKAAK